MSLGHNDIEKLYRRFTYECTQKKGEDLKEPRFANLLRTKPRYQSRNVAIYSPMDIRKRGANEDGRKNYTDREIQFAVLYTKVSFYELLI